MPLPTAPKVETTSSAAPAASVATEKKAVVIKQFGKAKDDAGNDIPAPSALGVDLVALCKKLYDFTLSELGTAGVDPEKFVEALEINKESVPGHKNGKAAYATANALASIFKHNGLLNKARGAGGYAKLKNDIAKKDNAIEALKARLVAMGMKPEEIEATLASVG